MLLAVNVTIHDLAGIFVGDGGRSVLDHWRGSHRRYRCCAVGYSKRCLEHCYRAINKRSTTTRKAFVHTCWKGIVEVVVPLWRDDVHVGSLFAGQWQAPRSVSRARLESYVADLRRLPAVDTARLRLLQVGLQTMASGLLAQVDEGHRLGRPSASRKEAIRRYIELHAARPIGLNDLAGALHLSASRTSHLVSTLMGRNFQTLLVAERVRKAQSLLRSTDLTVAEVGRLVGVDNECYFSRLFRSRTGVSASAYRQAGPETGPRPDVPDT